ncbi:pyridoxamine 5'-phosphate oxidase family protein [Rhodococcus rhodochrous]|uniref:pyridoxamine 5'-phosphate oxidase family protein n=1 Tax=Rhodococcus rhodochrous TaxID=1829 RepID=UPI0032DE3D7E
MRPDDPLVRTYLESSMVARVATRTPKGRPAMTPLWFLARGGRLHLGTSQASVVARNARANPDVVVLLDLPGPARSSEHVLRLRGRATVRDGTPSLPVLLGLARKYYLAGWRSELAHARQWRLRNGYYAQADGAVLEIEPLDAELLRQP